MKTLHLLENNAYTFADYFKLGHDIDEITYYFGYTFKRERYPLPHSTLELARLADLIMRLEANTIHTSLNSELARREFLIAPVLTEVIVYTNSQIRVEYPIIVNDKLKGSLGYLVEGKHQLLVIEAKNADLEQGFKQLAVELIALDQWIEDENLLLYGAVSLGNIWQFGILQRHNKQIIQSIDLFRVPADVEALLRIMIAIVNE